MIGVGTGESGGVFGEFIGDPAAAGHGDEVRKESCFFRLALAGYPNMSFILPSSDRSSG